MKLKCEFTYKCELEATKEEVEILKGKYAEKEIISSRFRVSYAIYRKLFRIRSASGL